MGATYLDSVPNSSPTVLVVDDDDDIRFSVRDLLVSNGYAVETAADGQAALDYMRRGKRPSLIVLDLRMPVRSGNDVLDALRSSTFVDVPVIVLSAYLSQPPAGAVAWLKKPVTPKLLLSTVGSYLSPSGAPAD